MQSILKFSKYLSVVAALSFPVAGNTATFDVLWWDSTPEYGGQAANSLRKAMSDYLTAYDGGSTFSSTYVDGHNQQGSLATQLATHSYDVIVFDATTAGNQFNSADLDAVKGFYQAGKNDLMLDGTLYIRNITGFGATNTFPGIGGDLGDILVNQVFALANNGGGIMVGTDHNCCQTDANQIVGTLLPGSGFTGITNPSTDGVFNGNLLLNSKEQVAASNVFNSWAAIPSQGIAPTGDVTDFLGNTVKLFSLVDVADKPGGGTKFSYISSSINPGSGSTGVDNPNQGGSGGSGGTNVVPLPGAAWMLFAGLGGIGLMRRRRSKSGA